MDERPASEQTQELSEARMAYALALRNLEEALPPLAVEPAVIELSDLSWPQVLLKSLLRLPRALLRVILALLSGITGAVGDWTQRVKARLICFVQGSPARVRDPQAELKDHVRDLLLRVLWARDHVQDAIENRSSASYASRSEVLEFVMDNEQRLHHLGQQALVVADTEISDLRNSQPKPPDGDRWWWFLNYPGGRFSRRMNVLWFALAIIPAMGAIILVTLLAQRLAINGPDLLSGASVVAQVGLGLASIFAGREVLNELIRRGANASWQGQITFAMTSLFLIVIVLFYYLVPPGAAMVYNVFGQQAIKAGNAAEAELYLESAARLDPDPHAAGLMEVGCLYLSLGAPDRAQTVFERALEADSRLLLARYHLAERYSDQEDYAESLQLLEDGLNLLNDARIVLSNGETTHELPGIRSLDDANKMQYLLLLARGRAFLENGAPERAQSDLKEAQALFEAIESQNNPANDQQNALSCNTKDDLGPYIITTKMNLIYYLARTWDMICDSEKTAKDALELWRQVRNSTPINSRQRGWLDEAKGLLSTQADCRTNYIPTELLSP